MERYGDKAIDIINELHTERLDYDSEYLPLINCAQQCEAYEDIGLTPEMVKVALGVIIDLADGDRDLALLTLRQMEEEQQKDIVNDNLGAKMDLED